MEDGKDYSASIKAGQIRVLPQRLLQLLVLFLLLCFTFSAVSFHAISYFRVYSEGSSVRPNLVPCYNEGEVGDLGQWIDPPFDLIHNMIDDELFRRASLMSRVEKYRTKRVPKIAFMFLTKGPLPLSPLWERFFKGHEGRYSIYVHSSPSYEADFAPSSVFYKRQIPSQVTEWGKTSMCDAERRLLANALLDTSNERFILLSESCIPLYNFTFIHNYILNSKYSFMSSFDNPSPYGRGRYNDGMLPEVSITQWRKGHQWFEINRNHAIHIVEDTKFYSKFSQFCRPPCYVDEHYFPTMLTIKGGSSLANRSLTWVDWSRGGAHPATFRGEDITEELLKRVYEGQECSYNDQISSVCYLFARKFSPSALGALFLIAPQYLGF